jgi:hypothetical protein
MTRSASDADTFDEIELLKTLADRLGGYCPACNRYRDPKRCNSAPFVNANPATYCDVALGKKTAV